MQVSINYLAVVVAAVVAFVLGAIWNGPLFGKAAGVARGGAAAQAEAARPSPGAMATIFVALLLCAWALAVIGAYMHLTTWQLGLKLGLLAWVGFLLPAMLVGAVTTPGGKRGAIVGIFGGSWLITCVVAGIIVTVWR